MVTHLFLPHDATISQGDRGSSLGKLDLQLTHGLYLTR